MPFIIAAIVGAALLVFITGSTQNFLVKVLIGTAIGAGAAFLLRK